MKHNPDNLTDEQAQTAEGWRLLDEDEVGGDFEADVVDRWHEIEWFSFYYGDSKERTYRTKLSRAELRAARGLPPEEGDATKAAKDWAFDFGFVAAFDSLSRLAHANARDKKFWRDAYALQKLADANGLGEVCKKQRASQLNALIVSECGEALEGLRKDLPSEKCPGFTNEEEEYADAIIRIMDMNDARGMRIGEAVIAKMRVNAGRPEMHGGKAF